jgi:outer membrane protein TolC
MRDAEQELFDQGQSTLLNLNIREQQAAESAAERVQAVLEYFLARADYAAAIGYENSSI